MFYYASVASDLNPSLGSGSVSVCGCSIRLQISAAADPPAADRALSSSVNSAHHLLMQGFAPGTISSARPPPRPGPPVIMEHHFQSARGSESFSLRLCLFPACRRLGLRWSTVWVYFSFWPKIRQNEALSVSGGSSCFSLRLWKYLSQQNQLLFFVGAKK